MIVKKYKRLKNVLKKGYYNNIESFKFVTGFINIVGLVNAMFSVLANGLLVRPDKKYFIYDFVVQNAHSKYKEQNIVESLDFFSNPLFGFRRRYFSPERLILTLIHYMPKLDKTIKHMQLQSDKSESNVNGLRYAKEVRRSIYNLLYELDINIPDYFDEKGKFHPIDTVHGTNSRFVYYMNILMQKIFMLFANAYPPRKTKYAKARMEFERKMLWEKKGLAEIEERELRLKLLRIELIKERIQTERLLGETITYYRNVGKDYDAKQHMDGLYA